MVGIGINRYRDLWVLGPMELLGTGTGVPWDLQVLGSVVPGLVCPGTSGYRDQWDWWVLGLLATRTGVLWEQQV